MTCCSQTNGKIEPRGFTPSNNFGAGGKQRTLVEVDRFYQDEGVVWQEDVYRLARQRCDELGVKRVVDFGTGSGTKFVNFFGTADLYKFQIDWDDRRDKTSSAEHDAGSEFIYANLDDYDDLERVRRLLDTTTPTLYIFSDVIEHLQDIRPALRTIRNLLRKNERSRLIISTPDRERVDGRGANSLPDNLGHVRQWTLDEFRSSIEAAGFTIIDARHVKQNNFDNLYRTLYVEVGCSDESYESFLSANNLPRSAKHVALTTEHSDCHRTGGIGSYHGYCEKIFKDKRTIVFCGSNGLPEDWRHFVHSKGWVHVAEFVGKEDSDVSGISSISPEENLLAILQIIFLYDEISIVEFQDYLGIGARIAQAKRAGMIPVSVTVVTYAHGNHFYLDNAAGSLQSVVREVRVDAYERLSLEQSDITLFPTQFLRDLYIETQGLQPRQEKKLQYPYLFSKSNKTDGDRGVIDTIIFYGKQTRQKGYPEFCEAIINLFGDSRFYEEAQKIRRIILMGVAEKEPKLDKISGVAIEYGVFDLLTARKMLSDNASNSIVVLPYKADNHPLSVFEVVDADCQLLASSAGGIPEMLPEELHADLLCEPSGKHILECIVKQLRKTFWDRARLLDKSRSLMEERYSSITQDFVQAFSALFSNGFQENPERGDVSVIIPNLNGEKQHFEDLAIGLRNSFFRPKSVEIVDDGSNASGIAALEEALPYFGSLDLNVTRHSKNLGLAAARNTGLRKIETEYVCVHDNDNIVLNRYLDVACRILDKNPDVDVVVAWHWSFIDNTSWRAKRANWDYSYCPIGQDLGLGLTENCFGDALAVYRTETLKRIGGWDQTSKSMWEDWQLFLKMTAVGCKVLVIPEPMFLYRLRESSMLRTYAKIGGEVRLGKALGSIKATDGIHIIQSLLNLRSKLGKAYIEIDVLRSSLAEAQSRGSALDRLEAKFSTESNFLYRIISRHTLARQLSEINLNFFRTVLLPALTRRVNAQLRTEGEYRAEKVAFEARLLQSRRDQSYLMRAMSAAALLRLKEERVKTGVRSFYRAKSVQKMRNSTFEEDLRLLELSGLFDADWYLKNNPDLALYEGSLLEHYLKFGGTEGRSPCPVFDSEYYLSRYPDVRDSGWNPLVHFIRFGAEEGRSPSSM